MGDNGNRFEVLLAQLGRARTRRSRALWRPASRSRPRRARRQRVHSPAHNELHLIQGQLEMNGRHSCRLRDDRKGIREIYACEQRHGRCLCRQRAPSVAQRTKSTIELQGSEQRQSKNQSERMRRSRVRIFGAYIQSAHLRRVASDSASSN